VWFKRPLGFVVTPKTRTERTGFPWRLVAPQLVTAVLLVVAVVTGGLRLWLGTADSIIGTGVNTAWIAYDLVVLSVIWKAALYRGPDADNPSKENIS
jgi:cellulose synthase (UDP-forming)